MTDFKFGVVLGYRAMCTSGGITLEIALNDVKGERGSGPGEEGAMSCRKRVVCSFSGDEGYSNRDRGLEQKVPSGP